MSAASPTASALAAAPEGVRLDFRRLMIVVAVMTGTLLEIIDSSIVNVALPDMMGNLGATLDEVSWVVTGYILSNVIVIPMTAWLSGRFGRKRYYTGSILIFTAASVLCGMAPSLPLLVLFRVLQGLGGGALLSTSQAIMIETFPPSRQGMAQALFGVGVMLGPSLGPTLGGWITDRWSWPWIFYVNLPLGLMAAFLSARFLRDSAHAVARKIESVDWQGILLLAIGVGALQWVLERGERYDWFESRAITAAAITAAVALVAFIVQESRAPHPVVQLRVLRHRALVVGCIFGAVLGVGLYGSVFLLPIFTQQLLHFTPWQSGMAILPASIATAISMLIAGRLVWRVGPRPLMALGIVILTSGLVGMSHWTLESSAHDLFWPQVMRGLGVGFLFVPISSATLTALPPAEVQQGAGLYNLARQLGGSFGIAALTTFLHHQTVVHQGYLSEHVSALDPGTSLRLAQLAEGFHLRGLDLVRARDAALHALDGLTRAQASVLSFEDAYLALATVFCVVAPLVALMRRPVARVAAPPADH
jgi:DHA2 family multidrug resistance protein